MWIVKDAKAFWFGLWLRGFWLLILVESYWVVKALLQPIFSIPTPFLSAHHHWDFGAHSIVAGVAAYLFCETCSHIREGVYMNPRKRRL